MRKATVTFYGLLLVTEMSWVAIVPLAPTFAERLSLSKLELGTLLAVGGFATLIVSIPIGLLADRLGARALTIGSSVVLVLSSLGQGLAGDFWSLLAARAAFGAVMGAIWTAGLAWLSHADWRHQSPAALGGTMAVAGIGIMIGPAFAGVLADSFGVGAPFFVLAGGAAVTTVGLVRYRGDGAHTPVHQPLGETLQKAWRDRIVLGSVAVMILIGFVNGGVNLLVPLELRHNGLSAGAIGAAFSASSAAFVVVSLVVTRLGASAVTVRAVGLAAGLYGLLMLIVIASAVTAAVTLFVVIRAPAWATLSTLAYPLGALGAQRAGLGRGAVMGLLNFVWGVASTVGPLTAGALAQAVGERWTFVPMAAVCLVTGAWLLGSAPAEAAGAEPALGDSPSGPTARLPGS